jgi:hypothetical protein
MVSAAAVFVTLNQLSPIPATVAAVAPVRNLPASRPVKDEAAKSQTTEGQAFR